MYWELVHAGSKFTLTVLYPIAFISIRMSSMFVAVSPGNTSEAGGLVGTLTPPPTAASSSLMPPHPMSTGTVELPPVGSTVSV
jgi:hypothetical protein